MRSPEAKRRHTDEKIDKFSNKKDSERDSSDETIDTLHRTFRPDIVTFEKDKQGGVNRELPEREKHPHSSDETQIIELNNSAKKLAKGSDDTDRFAA